MSSPSTRRVRVERIGFTLIELMIVVAIVGVLAVLAVLGYRKHVLTTKLAEAHNMIGAIRIAQEGHKAESGVYANIGPSFCPSTGLVTPAIKTGWNPACSGGTATWALLPVQPDGPVQFGYATVAPPATLPSIGWVDMSGADTSGAWYVIRAQADLDESGGGANTELVGTSFEGTIFSHNEGQ